MTDAPLAPPAPTARRSSVAYDVRRRVAEVALDRPDASNAFDVPMARSLADAFMRAGADPSVDVVLLHGRGRRFCGGGDLAAMAGAPDRAAYVAELADAAHAGVRAAAALRKPLVVAVQGAAAGFGLSLVLGADVVVAGESTSFVTAYTSVGLTPDGGMSWLLPRVVGQRRAAELLLTAEPITALRAVELGIASEICSDADVLARARERADVLAERCTAALGESRRLVRASWDRGLDEHLDDEAATITAAAATDATGGLIAGFLGGR